MNLSNLIKLPSLYCVIGLRDAEQRLKTPIDCSDTILTLLLSKKSLKIYTPYLDKELYVCSTALSPVHAM